MYLLYALIYVIPGITSSQLQTFAAKVSDGLAGFSGAEGGALVCAVVRRRRADASTLSPVSAPCGLQRDKSVTR